MSRTIEQKVVEMRFDNSNFEKNVSTSMNTLNKLQETISKTTSGNSFADLGKAANNLNFSGLSASIQTVTEKFSWLEEIAIGALRNIGANIEQHLVQALNKVTVDNIAGGFSKFGIMTEATQTILSAIADEDFGEVDKLDYVEGILEKLAWFSDETSYGLTDMTDNIAKFTAAGLDLDTSADAMMGIATWAANSGQKAQVAARAMYQLSQAMGQGTIQLMDWKSIETANMGTKEVKELLLEYGVLYGELEKIGEGKYVQAGTDISKLTAAELEEATITYANFRNHLSKEKWLTSEVFTEAMSEYGAYANALHSIIENNDSNIDNASQLIGYLDKAMEKSKETGRSIEDIMKEDFHVDIMVDDGNGGLMSALDGVTELSIRAMKASQQARTWSQVVDSITDAASTQWMSIFQSIFGNVEEATELFTDLSEYFWEVFVGPINHVRDIFREWKRLDGRSILFEGDESALENLKTAFKSLLNAFTGGYFSKEFDSDSITASAEKLKELTERFRDFTAKLILSEDTQKRISKVISNIGKVFKGLGQIIKSVFGAIKRVINPVIEIFKSVFGKDISNAASGFGKILVDVKNSIVKFFQSVKVSDSAAEKLTKIFGALKTVVGFVADAFGALFKVISGAAGNKSLDELAENFGGKFLDILLLLPSKIADAITAITNFIRETGLLETIGNVLKNVAGFLKGFFDAMIPGEGLSGKLETVFSVIRGFINAVKDSTVFQTVAGWIKDFFSNIKEGIGDKTPYETGVEVFNNLKTAAENLGNTIKTFGENIWNGLKKAVDAIKKFLGIKDEAESDTGDISKKGEGLGIGPVGNRTTGSFSIMASAFDGVSEALNITRSDAEETEEAGEGLSGILNSVGGTLGGILSTIASVLPGLGLGFAGFSLGKTFLDIASGLKSAGKGLSFLGKAAKLWGKSKKITARGDAISGVIKSLALLLISFAGSAYLMSKIPNPDTLITATGAMALFFEQITKCLMKIMGLGLIGSAGGSILGKILKVDNGGGNGLDGVGMVMLGLAGSIFLIALAAKEISEVVSETDPVTFTKAIGSIESLIWTFASGMAIITFAGAFGGGGSVKGLSLNFLAFAGSIKILANVAKDLAEFSKGASNINVGISYLERFVKLLSYLALVAGIAGSMGKGGGMSLLLATAAIAVMIILAKKVGELSKTDKTALDNGMATISTLAGVLAAMVLISSFNDASSFPKAAAGMLLAVVAIGALALVAKAIGDLQITADALITVALLGGFLAALAALFSSKFVNAGKIAAVSASLILMSAALLVMTAAIGVLASLNMQDGGLSAVWNAVLQIVVVLGALAIAAIALTSTGAVAAMLAVGAALFLIGVAALEFATAAQMIIESFILLAENADLLEQNLGRAMVAIVDGLLAAIGELFASIWEAVSGFFGSIWESISEFFVGIWNSVVEFFANFNLGEFFANIWEAIVGFFTETIPNLWGKLGEVWETVKTWFTDTLLPKIGGFFSDIWAAIKNFFTETIPNLGKKLGEVWESVKDWFVNDLIPGIGKKLENVWNDVSGWFKETFDNLKENGKKIIKNVWEGIKEKWEGVKDWIKGIVDKVAGFFSGIIEGVKESGRNVIEGFKNGIKEKWDAVKDWVNEKVEKLKEIWNKIFNTHSPSKVTEQIGKYVMEGFGIGIERNSGVAIAASEDAGDAMISAMSSAMTNIDSILSNDEFQPTITPVLDLTQIQNGAYAMGNLLDSYDNYSMRAAVAADYNPYVYQDGTLKVDNTADMAASVSALQQKFDDMLVKLSGMQIVMDSGTLVGELVDPMDQALGRKAIMVGRGI